ncbi:hypothetical protein LTR95_009860 [Oleoguttula sp. CCFEE 5521]
MAETLSIVAAVAGMLENIIRLLRIANGYPRDRTVFEWKGTMKQQTRPDLPGATYEAVSYKWNREGKTMEDAEWMHAREPLWVDMVCISQTHTSLRRATTTAMTRMWRTYGRYSAQQDTVYPRAGPEKRWEAGRRYLSERGVVGDILRRAMYGECSCCLTDDGRTEEACGMGRDVRTTEKSRWELAEDLLRKAWLLLLCAACILVMDDYAASRNILTPKMVAHGHAMACLDGLIAYEGPWNGPNRTSNIQAAGSDATDPIRPASTPPIMYLSAVTLWMMLQYSYSRANRQDRYQPVFLTVSASAGLMIGAYYGLDVPSSILSTVPWCVYWGLLASDMVHSTIHNVRKCCA